MSKISTFVVVAALAATALPAAAFAQMENGGMSGDSMSKGSMGGMKSKSMMMKKKKMMHHHSMHHGMMKKPMSGGSM